MTTFTVWKFDDPDRAEQMSEILHSAASDGLVKIVDYTVVTWPEGAENRRPTTSTRAPRGTSAGARSGAS